MKLAEESRYIVRPQEYRDILANHALQTRRIDPMQPRASAALVNAQHELGVRKRRVRDAANDPGSDHLAAGWREDIRRLRAVIAAD